MRPTSGFEFRVFGGRAPTIAFSVVTGALGVVGLAAAIAQGDAGPIVFVGVWIAVLAFVVYRWSHTVLQVDLIDADLWLTTAFRTYRVPLDAIDRWARGRNTTFVTKDGTRFGVMPAAAWSDIVELIHEHRRELVVPKRPRWHAYQGTLQRLVK